MMVKNGSRYLEYLFSKGEYTVMCVAFYDIQVDSCICERRSPISVFGKNISDDLFYITTVICLCTQYLKSPEFKLLKVSVVCIDTHVRPAF